MCSEISQGKLHLEKCEQPDLTKGGLMIDATQKAVSLEEAGKCIKSESITEEMWSLRKLIDCLNLKVKSESQWYEENKVNVETLFDCWTRYKDHVVKILESKDDSQTMETRPGLNQTRESIVHDARYWSSELVSLGLKVLDKVEAIFNFSLKNDVSKSFQLTCLVFMYQASTFLKESKQLKLKHGDSKSIYNYQKFPLENFFIYVAAGTLTEEMFFLRASQDCMNIMEATVYFHLGLKNIMEVLKGNSKGLKALENGNSKGLEALKKIVRGNWYKNVDSKGFSIFLFVMEQLLITTCSYKKNVYASRSCMVERLIYQGNNFFPTESGLIQEEEAVKLHHWIFEVISELVCCRNETIKRIRRSENGKDLILRLVVLCCMHCLNTESQESMSFVEDLLIDKKWEITKEFSTEFCDPMEGLLFPKMFKKVGNPLVIVGPRKLPCPHAILLDLPTKTCPQAALELLFSTMPEETSAVVTEASESAITKTSQSASTSFSKKNKKGGKKAQKGKHYRRLQGEQF